MKNELKKQIVDSAEAYMLEHKLSANQLAEMSGVNAGYIVAMRKGEYCTNAGGGKMVDISDKWFMKLAECIGLQLEKTYWETRKTPQLQRILATLEDAKEYGYTNIIIGDTGAGKTFVSNLFSRINPTDVFVIKVGSNDNIGDLIEKIMDKTKQSVSRTKSGKLRDIAAYMRDLNLKGFNPMLIFDESEYMKQPALCSMKELYDGLIGCCSIVMMGTPQLLRNIDIMRKKDKPGIPQFYRRVKFGIRVLPDIDKSFKLFLNGIDANLKKFLQDNCDNYGELHDVLVPAMREADRLGEPLTETLVRKILNMPEIQSKF